jgi:glycine betaine/proline transport system substrate-binding protein
VVHAGTDAALFAELESAYQRQAPVLLWVYTPHWAPIKYEGEWVEFPSYTPECYDDPAWGGNPDMAYDCGKPRGPIWKVSWSGARDKWPGAVKAIEAFTVSNEEMGAMIVEVDLEGGKVEDVVAKWITDNEDRWSKWIE